MTGGFRDRGEGAAAVFSNLFPQVLRDSIFADASGEIAVTLSGLPAGTHTVTSFHYDPQVSLDNQIFDILVDDALGAGQLKVDNAFFILFNQFNANHGRYTYQVTSNGIDDVVLTVRPDGGGGRTRFNGLQIESNLIVPEPSTYLLFAVGILGIIGMGYRQRKKAA